MTPERWQQIDRLFHTALEREPGERAVFLAEVCAGDEPLRRELETLIASHEGAEQFIETPASDVAAELLSQGQSRLEMGQQLGPYKVLSLLGTGGMGEVYLAEDPKLNRLIALKLLPAQLTIDSQRVRRLEREARAASSLNHPNIITIHEIGQSDTSHFIATEFIDGVTLRERMTSRPLKLGEALDIASQIASALAAAHEAGIIHRDIKPENVMLRRDGFVKVLDFGLAKLTLNQSTTVESEAATKSMGGRSNSGMVMGTVQYMSPEQAWGEAVDARTDIWSLGCVLYEMVAGRVPFEGETTGRVITAILEDEPAPLAHYREVPAELERILAKALRKERGERYQTASDLALDLKHLKQELEVEARLKRTSRPVANGREAAKSGEQIAAARGRESVAQTANIATARTTSSVEYLVGEIKRHRLVLAVAAATLVIAIAAVFIVRNGYFAASRESGGAADAPIDSVAVLPFVNASNDPSAEYLSDGISDSIISSLSRLPNLKVISLSAVMRFKGKQIDPQAVGRDLNVRAVLMGRMTQQGDNLAISTELVDVRDNRRLWGGQYNRKLADIIVVQDEISREIAEGLRLRLTGEEQKQLAKHYTDNTEAFQLYSLGLFQLRKNTKEGFDKSIDYFEQALKIDPNYALAYGGLGSAYFWLGSRGYWVPKEARQKMEWAALKQVELDETSEAAHAALAQVKKTNWDWAGADKEYKRALELDPNRFATNFGYCAFLIDVGRLDEALVYAKRAEELAEADSPRIAAAYVYLHKHDFDKAIELYLNAKEKNPRGPAGFQLAESYLGKGMYAEAVAEMQNYVSLQGDPQRWESYPILAYAYAKAGRRDEALKILHEQEAIAKGSYISPFNFAIIYTGLGDKDRAFEYLSKAVDEHVPILYHFPLRPLFDQLHSDPRFGVLIRRMGLEPYLGGS